MAFCISDACKREIDENWSFCPYCGEDNRSPDQKAPIGEHGHTYITNEFYCLICGHVRGAAGTTLRNQRVVGTITGILGLALFALSIFLILSSISDDELLSRHSQNTSTSFVATWIFMIVGLCFCAYAYSIFFPRQSLQGQRNSRDGRAYWNYDDEKPWYRRRNWPW